jgi:hypothetical protein
VRSDAESVVAAVCNGGRLFRDAVPVSMAVGTTPVPDESFVSWVERSAAGFGLTSGGTLRGFGFLGDGTQRIPLYGIMLADDDRARLAAVTGELDGGKPGARAQCSGSIKRRVRHAEGCDGTTGRSTSRLVVEVTGRLGGRGRGRRR